MYITKTDRLGLGISMSSYSKDINIGVIFPSRGLLFTETFQELLSELQDVTHKIYWSHGKKLPLCFNSPLRKALNGSHSHILICEDDMVLKPGILQELIDANKNIIACDYPISEQPSGTVLYDSNDKAIFTGTGFILIKKHVLDAMPKPIFIAGVSWDFKPYGNKIKFTPKLVNPNTVYGQHDINFGLYHYINGEPISVAETILSQRKLRQKGEGSSNDGTDKIIILDKYRKILCDILPKDTSANELLQEVIIDGRRMNVKTDLAEKLLANGTAFSPAIIVGDVIIDTDYDYKINKMFRRTK